MPRVDLSEHPVIATPYGRWQNLTSSLRLDALGVNAVVFEPGEEIDIAHDEADTGQQEVYVVVSGRAQFTIGDELVEAGPGTVVSAPDPALTRSYRALAPDTRIVCVGSATGTSPQAFGEWIQPA